MKITVVGAGQVGLVAACCLADFGVKVFCVDNNQPKISSLKKGKTIFYETGLKEILERNLKRKRLFFTTDLKESIRKSKVIFIAVGTPPKKNGFPDLSALEHAIKEIAIYLNDYKVIAIKSTVPIGTNKKMGQLLRKYQKKPVDFDLVSNPEFLREGSAVEDFTHPNRLIIGSNSEKAIQILKEIYRPLYLVETPFVITTPETAELIKYATNTFLAAKISFINEMSILADKFGADVKIVSKALGLDKRIAPFFLHPGPGFGGPCLPKDTLGLTRIASASNYDFKIGKAILEINQKQKELVVTKIKSLVGNLSGKTIGVLGLSFKPNTDDTRESPAIEIIQKLLKLKATIKAYDPAAMENAKSVFRGKKVSFMKNAYAVAKNSDCLVLLTEWNEFRELDMVKIRKLLKKPNFVDARNVYEPAFMKNLGFNYLCLGRNK